MSVQTFYGADISRWQGTVNWPEFNPGAAFVFIKATGGDGGMYVDSQYIANRDGARALGNQMPRGYYHFLGLDPVGEAKFFTDNVDFQVGECALLDEEVPGAVNPVSAKQWLDAVSTTLGFKPILYLSDAQILAHDWTAVADAGYAVFPADWAVSPAENVPLKYWAFYTFQQYEDNGHFPGISGNVDADAFFAEAITDFFKLGKQADAPTPVVPTTISAPVPVETPSAPSPVATSPPLSSSPVTPSPAGPEQSPTSSTTVTTVTTVDQRASVEQDALTVFNFLKGKKSYLTGLFMLGLAGEKYFTGATTLSQFLTTVQGLTGLNGIAIMVLRAAIAKVEAKL